MTSNLGATDIERSIGYAGSDLAGLNASNQAKINKAVRAHFKPEFINRIDETIVFNALSEQSIAQILDVEVAAIRRQILLNKRQPQHFVFKVQDQVSPSCHTKNSSRAYGPASLIALESQCTVVYSWSGSAPWTYAFCRNGRHRHRRSGKSRITLDVSEARR